MNTKHKNAIKESIEYGIDERQLTQKTGSMLNRAGEKLRAFPQNQHKVYIKAFGCFAISKLNRGAPMLSFSERHGRYLS